MDEWLTRVLSDMIDRIHGPFAFRFLLQPAMAALYAIADGLADARTGKSAYLWSVLTHPTGRPHLLREGMYRVSRIIGLGLVMDVAYQLIVFRWIYPLELIVIVLGLALLPYLVLRGPINRVVRHWTSQ